MKRVIPLALLAAGCIDPDNFRDSNEYIESQDTVPDWALPDTVTGETVAPSSYFGRASMFYFGHAT